MSKALAAVWLGGGSFAAFWVKLIIQKHLSLVEIQSDSLGIDAALKLILVWHLFSQHGSYTESQFIILKVRHELHIPFEHTV